MFGHFVSLDFKKGIAVSFTLHGLIIITFLTTPLIGGITHPPILHVTLQDKIDSTGKLSGNTTPMPQNVNHPISRRHQPDHPEQPVKTLSNPATLHENTITIATEKTVLTENQPSVKVNADSKLSAVAVEPTTIVSRFGHAGANQIANETMRENPIPEISDMRFGDRGAPSFIYQEIPVYPMLARRLGKEGRVLLKLLIDADGTLLNVEVMESPGYGFTEASIEAVKKSTYAPAHRYGIRTATRALLPISFRLQ